MVLACLPAPSLGRCLDSLAQQSLAREDVEVVVVLRGAPSTTRELAATVSESLSGWDSTVIESTAPTRAAARNEAITHVGGAYTTFVDAADTVSPGYLELMLAAAGPDRVAAARLVGGTAAADAGSAPAGQAITAPADALDLVRATGAKLYPTGWLRETPFVAHLASHEDLALGGHLFNRFDRQFAGFDTAPGRQGATYVVGEDAVCRSAGSQRDPASLTSAVTQRLDAVAALTRGTQEDPHDRTRLTEALVAQELSWVRRHLEHRPEARPDLERLVHGSGVRGLHLHGSPMNAAGGSGYALLHQPADRARRLVLVAGSARTVNQHARLIGFLSRGGHAIEVLHYRGRVTDRLRKLSGIRRLAVLPAEVAWFDPRPGTSSPRSRRALRRLSREGLRLGRRLAPEVVPARLAAPAFTRVDATAGAVLDPPSTVLTLDREGAAIQRAYGRPALADSRVGDHELAAMVLQAAPGRLRWSRDDAVAARSASRTLRGEDDRARRDLHAGLWTMTAYRLQRAARLEAAGQLLDDCGALFDEAEARAAGLACLTALQRIQLGHNDVDVVAVANGVIREADAALADDDLDRAVFLTTVALELLFARRLHTAELRSPIVSEPETFLAPLARSSVGQLLGRTTPRPASRWDAGVDPGMPRVTVLPGAYPKFADVVVEQLSGVADVEVLDLSAREGRFSNTGVDPVTVRERLLAATGHPPTVDHVAARALSADVVFVDWADKGLMWATSRVPEGTRVVVRMHGVDTLSAWLHTAEWEKVSDVIFPSEHLRRSAVAALGGRLDGVRQHVVANPVHAERYVQPKLPRAAKTLGMVGWAQQVKDPMWTLDLLAELRRGDPEWRLALIGADFPFDPGNPVERAAARAFRDRVTDASLSEAIDYVGYTRRLPEHLRSVGWAVSSSRREGFHIGLVEMAASGAVPVVRDWPVYAELEGARSLFPAEWVSDSPADAAARIRDILARDAWARESRAVVDTVRERFSGDDAGDQLRRIVLG